MMLCLSVVSPTVINLNWPILIKPGMNIMPLETLPVYLSISINNNKTTTWTSGEYYASGA
jgi:hypothetical protein